MPLMCSVMPRSASEVRICVKPSTPVTSMRLIGCANKQTWRVSGWTFNCRPIALDSPLDDAKSSSASMRNA